MGWPLAAPLDNAVVFDNGQVLSPGGLRRKDEPVRHKMLDAMGDLYVLGRPLLGHYEGVARRSRPDRPAGCGRCLSDPRNYRNRTLRCTLAGAFARHRNRTAPICRFRA